jgi:AcrR family transcriptional regulator
MGYARISAMMQLNEKEPICLNNGQRRSQRAHRAVLEALSELLLEQPLTEISIEAIAERAKVSKKTIYRWYPSKASLFMDLYNRESPNSMNIPDVGSFELELNQASLQIWRYWKNSAAGQAFRQLLASCQHDAQSLKELRDEYMPPRRKITKDIIDRAVGRGEIEDKNYEFVVDMVIGFNWYHLITDSLEDESVILRMTSAIIRGITPRRYYRRYNKPAG